MRSAKKAYSDVRPYVQRAVTDDEVRDNLKDAFYAARDIYDELFGGRSLPLLDGADHATRKRIVLGATEEDRQSTRPPRVSDSSLVAVRPPSSTKER